MRHGTLSGYTSGCRLDCCLAAKAESKRNYHADSPKDYDYVSDMLHELFPDGLTTPAERAAHGS